MPPDHTAYFGINYGRLVGHALILCPNRKGDARSKESQPELFHVALALPTVRNGRKYGIQREIVVNCDATERAPT